MTIPEDESKSTLTGVKHFVFHIKTRAVSDCLIRPLPASVNALLVKGGLFDNVYHLRHRFGEQINLANVHYPQIWIIYYLKRDC